jgi:hypothetical protein
MVDSISGVTVSKRGKEDTAMRISEVERHAVRRRVLNGHFVVGYQVFASKFAKAFALEPQGFAR